MSTDQSAQGVSTAEAQGMAALLEFSLPSIEGLEVAANMIRTLVSERDALASRVRALEGERDRAMRNRDMWKGQCERQAEQLASLRVHPHAREAVTWTPETGYVYADAALNAKKGGDK